MPAATNGQSDEPSSDSACSVIDAIQQIGSEWRLVVLHDLQEEEEKRFNEIKRSTGANSRTLSRVLETLQEAGLIARRLEEASPIVAHYRLTPKGRSLCWVSDEIEVWADGWQGAP